MRKRYIPSLVTALLPLLPWSALAMPTVSLSFAGHDSYVLSATDLEKVERIEGTVQYDPTLLGTPRLSPKSSFDGISVTVDDATPGNLHLVVTSTKPMQGKGALAILSLDAIGTKVGGIGSFSGAVYGSGGPASAIFQVTNPSPQLDPSDPDDIPVIAEREKKGETFMGGDVTYLPPEAASVVEKGAQRDDATDEKSGASTAGKDSGAAGEVAAADVTRVPEPEPEKDPAALAAVTPNVLERFRLFKGVRNPQNLMLIFVPGPALPFAQDPPILISDGRGKLRVTISNVPSAEAPNFAMRSASYISSTHLGEGKWRVEVQPDKGAVQAAITLLRDGAPQEIPLVVSPPARVDLIAAGKVSEDDFELFLRERGSAQVPQHDLNGDGKRDYLDEYIFTANYLLALEKKHVGKER